MIGKDKEAQSKRVMKHYNKRMHHFVTIKDERHIPDQ